MKKYLIAAGLTIGLTLVVARVVTWFIEDAPVLPERHQSMYDR